MRKMASLASEVILTTVALAIGVALLIGWFLEDVIQKIKEKMS